MKLFVWRGVYRDYSCGMAFAIAEDAEQARALVSAGSWAGLRETPGVRIIEGAWSATMEAVNHAGASLHIDSDLAQPPEVYELDTPIGFGVYGGG